MREIVRATLTADPVRDDDGIVRVEATIGTWDSPVELIVLPPCDGEWLPYASGDEVVAALIEGDPNAGGYVIRQYVATQAPQASQNREIRGRAGADVVLAARAGQSVRLGDDSGDPSYQPLMLYTQAKGELSALKAQIDALAGYVDRLEAANNPASPAAPPGGATTAVEAAEYADGHIGGEWSKGVLAVVEDEIGGG